MISYHPYLRETSKSLDIHSILYDDTYRNTRRDVFHNILTRTIYDTWYDPTKYCIAVAILQHAHNAVYTSWYAMSIATSACKHVDVDMARRVFGLQWYSVQECDVHTWLQLHNTEPQYKLMNQQVYNGIVYTTHNFGRLHRQLIYEIITTICNKPPVQNIPDIISYGKILRTIHNTRPKHNTKYPPCIENIIKQLQNGENVNHYARYTLTSYLHYIGVSRDDIIRYFGTAPDYNQKITTYHVDNILKSNYTPPNCDKISLQCGNNTCHRNIKCKKNPIQY
ncbi:MAG: hypothetical protein F4Z07_06160 [Dehalococcoidia bacterium]|nr:hypothetical protein [Dehalococcoidia bacterium]